MPFSKAVGYSLINGGRGKVFDSADFAGDIAIEKTIVEAGKQGRSEAVRGEEGVRFAFA